MKASSKIILVVASLLVGLLLTEGVFRLFSSPKPTSPPQLTSFAASNIVKPDPYVRWRMIPNTPDHDSQGWRNGNGEAPKQVDIIAIGDSHTWGSNVVMTDAWNQALGRMLGTPVYQMALGYYNIVEYWLIVQEALRMNPKTIIIGLYLGNDIYGTYQIVYYIDPDYKFLGDPVFAEKYASTNVTTDPVQLKLEEIGRTLYGTLNEVGNGSQATNAPLINRLRRHSFLLQYISNKWNIWQDAPNNSGFIEWAKRYPEYSATVTKNGTVGEILHPAYRLLMEDMSDPKVMEGLRLTKNLCGMIKEQLDKAGVKLLILEIPTEELVYKDLADKPLSLAYLGLIENETAIVNDLNSYFDSKGIAHISALKNLEKAAVKGEPLYPAIFNGHPIAAGYKVYAETVYQYLIGNEAWSNTIESSTSNLSDFNIIGSGNITCKYLK